MDSGQETKAELKDSRVIGLLDLPHELIELIADSDGFQSVKYGLNCIKIQTRDDPSVTVERTPYYTLWTRHYQGKRYDMLKIDNKRIYYVNEKRHRDGLPAVIYSDGVSVEYYNEGRKITDTDCIPHIEELKYDKPDKDGVWPKIPWWYCQSRMYRETHSTLIIRDT